MYLCETELFEIEQIINIKMDLALNNRQMLICHKTHQTKPNQTSERAIANAGVKTRWNNNGTLKLPLVFDIQTDHQISAWRPDLTVIDKKKRTCKIEDFAVPADHRIKLKEWEKKDKYLDLAREF